MNADEIRNVLHAAEDEWERDHSCTYPRLPFVADKLADALAAERDSLAAQLEAASTVAAEVAELETHLLAPHGALDRDETRAALRNARARLLAALLPPGEQQPARPPRCAGTSEEECVLPVGHETPHLAPGEQQPAAGQVVTNPTGDIGRRMIRIWNTASLPPGPTEGEQT